MPQRLVRVDARYNRRHDPNKSIELGRYIYEALDGASHDTGALEAVDAKTNNACRLLARLLVRLVERGMLPLEEIPELLDNDDRLTDAPESLAPEKI